MSRAPDLKLLSPPEAMAAAERILAHPACNTQRTSLNEIYTFATATTQLGEVADLAAGHLRGTATPEDTERLRLHLHALGALPLSFTPPNCQKEARHGQG